MPEQQRLSRELDKRVVTEHHWGAGDSRLLVVTASTQLEASDGQQNLLKRRQLTDVSLSHSSFCVVLL